MLRHSQDTTGNTTDYANGRFPAPASSEAPFTAEEIAEAIAEIEFEQQAKKAPQSNTARVESILSQTNRDMAASDVSAKIVRRRHAKAKLWQRRRMVFIGGAVIASCLGFAGFFLSLNQHPTLPPVQVAPVQMAVPAEATEAAVAAVAPATKMAITQNGAVVAEVVSAQNTPIAAQGLVISQKGNTVTVALPKQKPAAKTSNSQDYIVK